MQSLILAKVAEYEFTTLVPQLGMVQFHDHSFTVADLPGLIKGASLGKGLGIQFLKHIERCKIIAHIIDFGSEDKDPIEDFEIINNELKNYNLKLEQKTQLVIANKSDMDIFPENVKKFKAKYPNVELIEISAIFHKNLDLVKKIMKFNWKKSIWNIRKPRRWSKNNWVWTRLCDWKTIPWSFCCFR
ncbi:GTPase [Mycoplasmopsis cynos]|uniref:GTPase n=1 Tax=Mycoplasmopsis cynos TaxID=171284 RepID=UPI003A5C7C88